VGREEGMKSKEAYLWIKLVETNDGSLDIAIVDVVLYLPALYHLRVLLLLLQVGLLGELFGCLGISFHHKIVKDQGVDVTIRYVSS
jgi:hypothetical protein